MSQQSGDFQAVLVNFSQPHTGWLFARKRNRRCGILSEYGRDLIIAACVWRYIIGIQIAYGTK